MSLKERFKNKYPKAKAYLQKGTFLSYYDILEKAETGPGYIYLGTGKTKEEAWNYALKRFEKYEHFIYGI